MKRSPTSLVPENVNVNKPVIGLIFGRNTSIDRDNVKLAIMNSMLDTELMDGTLEYLTEHEEGSYVDNLIKDLSKVYNVAIFKHKLKPEDFKTTPSIRMARRRVIDVILSKSLTSYFVTVKDDPECTLTKIVKNEVGPWVINVHHVRSKEEIEKDPQTLTEKIAQSPVIYSIKKIQII